VVQAVHPAEAIALEIKREAPDAFFASTGLGGSDRRRSERDSGIESRKLQ
jgi:hypothetical protein